MQDSLEDTIITRYLHWLGHLTRMEGDRVPKKVLLGWLLQPRPSHGTKMRWRDRVRKDLRKFDIDERPGRLKHRKEQNEGRSGTEAWNRAPRADYKKMSTVLQGEQPEVGNSLLLVTPPGSPLPVTHASVLSDEAKTLPNTNVPPHS